MLEKIKNITMIIANTLLIIMMCGLFTLIFLTSFYILFLDKRPNTIQMPMPIRILLFTYLCVMWIASVVIEYKKQKREERM